MANPKRAASPAKSAARAPSPKGRAPSPGRAAPMRGTSPGRAAAPRAASPARKVSPARGGSASRTKKGAGKPVPPPEPGTFEAAATFSGAREGFVFKRGVHGLGYYRDEAPPRGLADTMTVLREVMSPAEVGTLTADDVRASLPEVVRAAFDARDIDALDAALRTLPPAVSAEHMSRCVAAAMWDLNAGSEDDGDGATDAEDDACGWGLVEVSAVLREERSDGGAQNGRAVADHAEVFARLPAPLMAAFDAQDVDALNTALRALRREVAVDHMRDCVGCGLWDLRDEEGGHVATLKSVPEEEAAASPAQPALSPQQKTPERDAESEIAALRAELQVERDARMAAEQALEAAHAEIVRLGGAEPITTSESC